MSDHPGLPLGVTGDIVSGLAVMGAIMGYLPTILTVIATVMAVAWYSIQIYEWWQRRNGAQPPWLDG